MAVKAGTANRRTTAAGLWLFASEQDIEPGCLCFGLHTADHIQHRWRNIGMVMDYLPLPRFTAIDVRDALLDGNLLSGDLKLPVLVAHFVGHIPGGLEELIFEFNAPVRRQSGYFLKRSPDCIPTDFPTADWVHGRYGRTVRPDVYQ